MNPELKILDNDFTIHRLDPDEIIPAQVYESSFYWLGKTDEELSLVCDSSKSIRNQKQETGWKCIKVVGPLEFTQVGIIAEISSVLAGNGISIFVLSTFDTDYILVKQENLDIAVQCLKMDGYHFI